MSESPDDNQAKSSPVRVGKAFVIGTLTCLAASAGVLSNIDIIIEKFTTKCIAISICAPSQHYLNARIKLLSPSDPSTSQILSMGDQANPGELFMEYSANISKQADFSGTEYLPADGNAFDGTIDGYPLQIGDSSGDWDPSEGFIGWRIGFPIIDILIGARESVNVTDIDVEVLKAEPDPKPYVQLVAELGKFSKITFVNESIFASVNSHIEFSVVPKNAWIDLVDSKKENKDICKHLIRSGVLDYTNLKYKSDTIKIADQTELDLSKFLRKELPDFEFYAFRNDVHSIFARHDLTHRAAPKGYEEWEKTNSPNFASTQWGSSLIYGKLVSGSEEQNFTTAFCTFVSLKPLEDIGGFDYKLEKVKMVKLETKKTPYTLNFDTVVRLDQGKPYFRSAIFFTSEKSATFDVVLRLKSFGKVVYESDMFRLHLFVPRTTVKQLELKIAGKEFIPRSQ